MTLRLYAILVCAALLALAGCPQRPQQAAWTGNAPGFTYTTFDGRSVELSSHAGTPVVLNFWNDW